MMQIQHLNPTKREVQDFANEWTARKMALRNPALSSYISKPIPSPCGRAACDCLGDCSSQVLGRLSEMYNHQISSGELDKERLARIVDVALSRVRRYSS